MKKPLVLLIVVILILSACNASTLEDSDTHEKISTAISLPTYQPAQATATPTQEFSPKMLEATLIASTETTPFAFHGVSILFTAPYSGTCQIYQVAGKKLLTTGGDCYAVLPANNILWGKIIGASLIGPLMPSDDFTLPTGVLPVKKIITTADSFGITPESISGMTQVGMLKVKMNGEIWPLMIKIQVGWRQRTAGPKPTQQG